MSAREIFGIAFEIESPTERAAYLDEACKDNPELRAEVEELLAAHAEAGDFMMTPIVDLDAVPPPLPERYEVVSKIDKGGQGVVWRVVDRLFQRPLAVKVMWRAAAADPSRRARFEREAHLTGTLQHPAIPPVVDRGTLGDGRPFYTMKLVDGETLADLLKARPTPSHDLPKFLGIFEQICQAVGYAHSQRVIHRDLKPSNVMVGAFGEVQVMDWGLGKKLDDPEPEFDPEETTVDFCDGTGGTNGSFAVEDVTLTRNGQAVGTLAYMPPEQALGQLARVDARADVFSLGGLLLKILTGAPPYSAPGLNELHKLAAAADLSQARAQLDCSGADVELLRLTELCLSPAREERPESATAVARRVAEYQQGLSQRLEHEKIERAQEHVQVMEERKRRRVWAGLASAIAALVLLACGTGLWIYVAQVRRENEQQQQQIRETDRLARLREDHGRSIGKIRDWLDRHRFAEAELELVQAKQRLGRNDPPELSNELEEWQRGWGIANRLDQIRQKFATILEARDHYDWQIERDYETAFEELGLGMRNEAPQIVAQRIRATTVAEHLVAAVEHWAVARQGDTVDESLRKWLFAIAKAADPDEYRDRFRDPKLWQDRERLKHVAAQLDASRLSAPLLFAITMRLEEGPEPIAHLRNACAHHPRDFWLNFGLGMLLQRTRTKEAIGYYRVALTLRPDTPVVLNNLAYAYVKLGELDHAIVMFNRALEIRPTFRGALHNRAVTYRKSGQIDRAIQEYNNAIKIDPSFADFYFGHGYAYAAKGEAQQAIKSYEKAIDLDPEWAEAHVNLGVVLADNNQRAKAVDHYKKALKINPTDANALTNLGIEYRALGELPKAIAHHKMALKANPNHALAHYNLGNAYYGQKDWDNAIRHYGKAIEARPAYYGAWHNLGDAWKAKGNLGKTVLAYKQAAALGNRALSHYELGNAYRSMNELSKAIERYRTAIRIDQNHAESHCHLGLSLAKLGRFEEALPFLRRGDQLGRKRGPRWSNPSVLWVRLCEGFIETDQMLKTKKKPKDAVDRVALANLCRQYKQRYAQATQYYQEAFEAQPSFARNLRLEHRYNAACAAALAAAGRGKDAANLKNQERKELRDHALKWLRADLAVYEKDAETKPSLHKTIAQRLTHWRKDADLAIVREIEHIAKLPTDEQMQWLRLWLDVENLLRKVSSPKEDEKRP